MSEITPEKIRKAKVRKRFYIESIALFIIIVSPFIFKLHQYLPGDPDATIHFLGMTFDRNGFADLNTYGWFLLSKIVPFVLLVIWFFTCKHWWYHIILIPTTMYAFQVFEVIYSDDDVVDTDNLLWLLPVCMVVIPFVYFIRIKLIDKHVHGIDLEAMEAELRLLKQKQGAEKKDVSGSDDMSDSAIQKPSREYRSLSEKIEYGLSTHNIETKFKQFQNSVRSLLHL